MSKIIIMCFSLFISCFAFGDEFGNEIEELKKREISALPQKQIQTPEKEISFKIESIGEPKVKDIEGCYYLSVDIGTQAPIECYVYKQRGDPAFIANNFMNIALKSMKNTEIESISSGIFENDPFLSMNKFYLINQNGMDSIGYLKIIVISKPSNTIVCLHDEHGYIKSFKRIAKGISSSFNNQYQTVAPFYEEISIATLNNTQIGL